MNILKRWWSSEGSEKTTKRAKVDNIEEPVCAIEAEVRKLKKGLDALEEEVRQLEEKSLKREEEKLKREKKLKEQVAKLEEENLRLSEEREEFEKETKEQLSRLEQVNSKLRLDIILKLKESRQQETRTKEQVGNVFPLHYPHRGLVHSPLEVLEGSNLGLKDWFCNDGGLVKDGLEKPIWKKKDLESDVQVQNMLDLSDDKDE